MFLIESTSQLQQLADSSIKIKLLVPVWSSTTEHELDTTISFVFCKSTEDHIYVINLNHIDAERCASFDSNTIVDKDTFVYGIRYINCAGIDYEWAHLEEYGRPFIFGDFTNELYRNYNRGLTDINDSIPIMKWAERLNELPIPTTIRESDHHYTSGIITLGNIEGAGVYVNDQIFTIPYIQTATNASDADTTAAGGPIRLRTRYNPYTATGRPSNRHRGINWAGFPKGGTERKGVVSRHKGGTLISMDYESYHLHLIAKAAGYRFPDGESPHTHLGRYYGTDTQTAKSITFRLLYGGIPETAKPIPFFAAVDRWAETIWHRFTIEGGIRTPIWGRWIPFDRIPHAGREKVINYLIQATETEINLKKLGACLPHMAGAHPILYTYDSLIIDAPAGWDGLPTIRQVMEAGGLPMRITTGSSWAECDDL